jgi:hypothetical protein
MLLSGRNIRVLGLRVYAFGWVSLETKAFKAFFDEKTRLQGPIIIRVSYLLK